jgi:hypothetical protein
MAGSFVYSSGAPRGCHVPKLKPCFLNLYTHGSLIFLGRSQELPHLEGCFEQKLEQLIQSYPMLERMDPLWERFRAVKEESWSTLTTYAFPWSNHEHSMGEEHRFLAHEEGMAFIFCAKK